MRRVFIPSVPILAAFAAFLAPAPASAVVLDDFEWSGPFVCSATPPETCVHVGLNGSPLHVMTYERRMQLDPASFGTIWMHPDVEHDDGVRITFAEGGGIFTHTLLSDCEGLAVDLSEGGAHDRLELRFDEVTTPLDVQIEIVWNEGSQSTFSSLFVPGPGTFGIPMGVPITSACWMQCEFRAESAGSFCLTDMRTAAPGHFAAGWEQDVLTFVGPPPLERMTWGIEQGGDLGVRGEAGLTLERALDDAGAAVPVEAGISGVPSPCSVGTAFESMQGAGWIGKLPLPVAVEMALRFDFTAAHGNWIVDSVPETVATGEGYSVAFSTRRNLGGEIIAVGRHTIAFECPEGAPWKITSLLVEMPAAGPPNEFVVLVDVVPLPGADPDDTILQLHQTASLAIPGGGTTEIPDLVAFAEAAEVSRLRAAPGITASGTRFLLDVRGRRVRTLTLRGGEAAWDGRDESGARLGAGVYWGRVRSGGEAARVTLVR